MVSVKTENYTNHVSDTIVCTLLQTVTVLSTVLRNALSVITAIIILTNLVKIIIKIG